MDIPIALSYLTLPHFTLPYIILYFAGYTFPLSYKASLSLSRLALSIDFPLKFNFAPLRMRRF